MLFRSCNNTRSNWPKTIQERVVAYSLYACLNVNWTNGTIFPDKSPLRQVFALTIKLRASVFAGPQSGHQGYRCAGTALTAASPHRRFRAARPGLEGAGANDVFERGQFARSWEAR